MTKAYQIGFGGACGTLLTSLIMQESLLFALGRSMIVGVVTFILVALWTKLKA